MMDQSENRALTLVMTGTDTGVGKTHVSCALLHQARSSGLRAGGYKPVASGAAVTLRGLRNNDALALMDVAGEVDDADGATYKAVNPYCFAPPIAPHLAAEAVGVRIGLDRLDEGWMARAGQFDLLVIEGAGGWLVPLNEVDSFADWVAKHRWPVILVVGLRLGCINHALLSAEAISRRTTLAGWVANHVPPGMSRARETITTLHQRLPVPCLGEIPLGHDAAVAASGLDWPRIVAAPS